MSTQDEFAQQVREALNHLYDFARLDHHPLAVLYWPEARSNGPSRAQRLHRLLLEAIGSLLPLDGSRGDSRHSRYHALLVARYVEEWPLDRILGEFGCSRRQFFREQQEAVAMLAALLRERFPPPPVDDPADPFTAEAQRVLTQRETLDIAEVARGVLPVANTLAQQRGVVLQFDLAPQLPTVAANRTLLRQVLLRALSDLVTQPGTRRVALRLRTSNGEVAAELTNEMGPGEALRQNLTGLDAARRLVELMGGHWQQTEITAEGCTYCFTLPGGEPEQRVLLVIEDNEGVIRAFQRYLGGYGYRVIGAASGQEALRLARELRPTAITLDVMMPGQDGWEILQALKNDPITRHIPVLICSVLVDPQLAHALGAAAYVQKPVTQDALLSALAGLTRPPA